LDRFSIPKLEEGTFRAFEIKGTSMQPINEGSIVIGKYIEHIRDLRNNRRYILILKEEGVIFKRVIKEIDVNNRLVLISDNPEFLPFTVHLENILEAWEMIAFVGYGDKIEDSSSFLMQKMNQIEQKMNQIIGAKTNLI
jgi:phage repressor protein C with HTH and peptisase S24 domain